MKVFVTGVAGQLGYDVVNELKKRGYASVGSDVVNPSASENEGQTLAQPAEFELLDITDASAVEEVLTRVHPDAVVHCAAWTAVDLAEDEDKRKKVYAINAGGTENLARVCKKLDCKMVYISTDYVFNGQGIEPWQPDCKEYAPLNVYGQTKLEGELAVSRLLEKFFIVRIAWVFGKNGNNFIKTMLNVGKKYDTVRVVCDQIGTPTYTYDLARLLVDMAETEKYGYYHATNEGGYISWYDFTCEIFKQAGYSTKVVPVTTEEYGLSKAARPFNSRLCKKKLEEYGFKPLPTWQDALARYLKEMEDNMGKIKVTEDCNGIRGLKVIEPTVFGDARGYFVETYNYNDFAAAGIDCQFVQDNQSASKKGVLRGLHFQINYPQDKLVRVICGEVYDVAVDLREGSETFGKWFGVVLSAENKKQFFIPKGFAHGFLVLSDYAEFCYKVTDFYYPNDEGGILWKDPAIGVEWPLPEGMSEADLIFSEKDTKWGGIEDYKKEHGK